MQTDPPKPVPYDENATAADGFVWDNKDCVILFAAGNDRNDPGAPPTQIGDSAAAKNCITVGASYSSRKTNGYVYDPTGIPGNPEQIAPFSSKGPSFEKRMKPDVAAPGTAILSTCSRDPAITNRERQRGGPTDDPLWMFLSGTSMATPLVAGVCATIRQAVIKLGGNFTTPSAALIKALLINGALASNESDTASDQAAVQPNGDFGFGFVSITHVLAGLSSSLMIDEQVGLQAANANTYKIALSPVRGKPGLKVTLAYSDRAGRYLQNKLTLSLMQEGSGVASITDTIQSAENNVQQIIVHAPTYPVTLSVRCDRIANNTDTQPFALAWQFIQ